MGGATNSPPAASFTYKCINLTCNFTDTSTDGDGLVNTWSWTFGDGDTSTTQNPGHTFGAGGTYTVSLAVTDDDGATHQTSQSITVRASAGITLSASAYKVKGVKYADLTWSGATSNVDVYRAGALIVANTANDGTHTDNLNSKGGGSTTYKVCETGGTSTCSNEVNVTW